MKYLLVLPLLAFLLFASDRVAPNDYIFKPAPNTDGTVWSDDFEDNDISDWTIDGTMNWGLGTNPHSGTYGIQYEWGYLQDTRAATPQIVLPAASTFEISWWWSGSYYWMVDPNDHSTFSIEVIEVGNPWPGTVFWTENDNDPFPFTSWVYYNQFVTLDETWSGKTIQIGFHVVGDDDATIYVDDVMLQDFPVALERETWGEIKSIF